ncbi:MULTISPECIES: hypothetical protein [unclassified Variovorax]|uniref:hypothetical protein n=1 Tax=unclassified Variovorax TaxID=663243 RepID=UPI003ECEC18B
MALNPVERRLVDLRQHWEAFRADQSKRLLVWEVPDSATRMLQCFFEAQKHESEYATGDLFVVFDAPFANSIQYARALKQALAGQYEASREALDAQGITADWQFDPQDYPDSASGFLGGLRSFGSGHHAHIGHLVAVLMPESVADDRAWASWLSRALDAGPPERLRLAVIDSIEAPRLAGLSAKARELTYVDAPKIDALATAQETFAQEAVPGPVGVFRNYLIGLVTLVEKGSADQVKAKAADAVVFARKQKWADQEVAVSMLFAGALLKEKRFDESAEVYRHARQLALQAAAVGHPVGRQLVLQTWFGEAGVHLAAGAVPEAAKCYDQAAAIAQQIPNLVLAIEALRMGAFCHARVRESELATERGFQALSVGERLKPDARAITTLPLAAMDLLRVIDPERVGLMEGIKQRLDARVEASGAAAEARAADLENSSDAEQFRAVEKDLAREIEHGGREAAQELDAVAAGGNEQFVDIFSYARELIGPQWPLGTALALPAAPRAGASACIDGIAAS